MVYFYMNKLSAFLVMGTLSMPLAWADSAADANQVIRVAQPRAQEAIPEPKINPVRPAEADSPAESDPETARLQATVNRMEAELENVTLDDLKQNRALAEKALNYYMLREQWHVVEKILPIYKAMDGVDLKLIDYAQASLYRTQGEYKKAVALYRKMIADDPKLLRIRFDLATSLFHDWQNIAAKDQFLKLRSEEGNDEFVIKQIDAYLDAIAKRGAWSFGGGLSYVSDNNINNASSSETIRVGNLLFKKTEDSLPQSAHGLRYSFDVGKDWNISNSNYLTFSGSIDGEWYWDNHEFDDLSLRLSSGYKYADANNSLTVAPFASLRFVNNKSYSNTFGLSLNASRWLTANMQISNYNELAWEKSKVTRNKPSERKLYTSLNMLWAPSSTQYFVFGGNVFDVKAQSKAASYVRPGVSASWNKDWDISGFSSNTGLSFSKRFYKDVSLYGVKREDRELTLRLSVWNRDWYFWGITPKLSYTANFVNSNIPDLYSYDKHNVFLQFDKRF